MRKFSMEKKATIEQPLQMTGRDGAIDHVAKMQDVTAGSLGRRLYASPNGDTWYLVRDMIGIAVVHVPNAASGGRAKRMELGEFLIRGGNGPEHQELMRLIGSRTPRAPYVLRGRL